MTREEINKLPYIAQLYINDLQRKIEKIKENIPMELKDKEVMNWGEWKKAFIVEEKNGRFWHADGGRWSFAETSWKYNDYKKKLITQNSR
jgi:hypothetical protein